MPTTRLSWPEREMQNVQGIMKLPLIFCLGLWVGACATLPLPDENAPMASVEVQGHVTSCSTTPLSEEPVKLWSAGELDALDSTRTDSEGAFWFKVETAQSNLPSLLIEARGVRARATPNAKGKLVAELVLPCGG
jgi:hypothetical protein